MQNSVVMARDRSYVHKHHAAFPQNAHASRLIIHTSSHATLRNQAENQIAQDLSPSSSSPPIPIPTTTTTTLLIDPLRLIPPILANPHVLHGSPEPDDLADEHDDVPRRLLGPPPPRDGHAEREAAPQREPDGQAREPRDDAPDPREHLDDEEEGHDEAHEEDRVGRAGGEELVEAGEEGAQERGEEAGEVVLQVAQGRRGPEEVGL